MLASYNPTRRKVVLVGDAGCGKTSMLTVFVGGVFPAEDAASTIFDTDVVDVEVDDETIELAVWDTAGDQKYSTIRPLVYADADVVLVCYSVSDRKSLSNVVDIWEPEVRRLCGGGGGGGGGGDGSGRLEPVVVVVGTKSDVRVDPARPSDGRMTSVTATEGKAVAKRVGAIWYVECSALRNDGVREVFELAARANLVDTKPSRPQRRQRKRGGCFEGLTKLVSGCCGYSTESNRKSSTLIGFF